MLYQYKLIHTNNYTMIQHKSSMSKFGRAFVVAQVYSNSDSEPS